MRRTTINDKDNEFMCWHHAKINTQNRTRTSVLTSLGVMDPGPVLMH